MGARIGRFSRWVAALALALWIAPAEARPRRAPPSDGLDPDVGRNAPTAIADGLAGQGQDWIDTMGNAFARPERTQSDPFAYYRRRAYGAGRR